ncbi:MAG: alanine--tRNA ligase [Alphaproteobacteria bacterium]|nr:alanine--tRNA ligase [Alphaproteobacteria bacterium]
MNSAELRTLFLEFFQRKGHVLAPSAPLVPHNDPTLLFTSAGMVPFKDYFTGAVSRPYPTAASCQKCVRAGGKHNDLEQVGHTKRHHTFFEMLGNFSFGDYFKEAAILYAWTFLTDTLQLDKNRLWITVYHTDHQAVQWWKKIAGLGDDRIIRIATSDNFWSAGDMGPCGPCSEIFYDHGDHIFGGLPGTADQYGDRYVELWNLVFMQFDQKGPDERVDLPSPSIDTGMGLERIAAVVQGVNDNFETDIFKAIIDQSVSLCPDQESSDHVRVAHRVVADHLRSSSFLLAEGVLPSNEGRGYVVRRIMRRALRHIHFLGAKCDHLAQLVPVLIEKMGAAYPELGRTQDLITSVLSQEGEQFEELLRKGLRRMEGWLSRAKKGDLMPGADAFTLYDTFGFPLDLTQDIVKEKGCGVDEREFHICMSAQKEQSRASWSGSGGWAKSSLWDDLNQRYAATAFVGYDDLHALGQILCMAWDQEEVGVGETSVLKASQTGYVVLDQTSFYPESGGQKGDGGQFTWTHGSATVLDTMKKGHLIAHLIQVNSGQLKVNDTIHCAVDSSRHDTAAHHSATHLLQAALRRVLGKHVMQKGSSVSPDRLRFDFSHQNAVSWDQLESVENMVNGWIRENTAIETKHMPQDVALASGAMAFFGEKYDDVVRVISMGDASVELCGGTHAKRTGDLGLFKIISESGVAGGVRRIEAVVGKSALKVVQTWHDQLRSFSHKLKTPIVQLSEKIDTLNANRQSTKPACSSVVCQESAIGSVVFWHAEQPRASFKDLKTAYDQVRKTLTSGIVVLTSTEDDTTCLILGVTPDLNHDAAVLLKTILAPFQVSSGGRKDLAQGGGKGLPLHPALMNHIIQTLEPVL